MVLNAVKCSKEVIKLELNEQLVVKVGHDLFSIRIIMTEELFLNTSMEAHFLVIVKISFFCSQFKSNEPNSIYSQRGTV